MRLFLSPGTPSDGNPVINPIEYYRKSRTSCWQENCFSGCHANALLQEEFLCRERYIGTILTSRSKGAFNEIQKTSETQKTHPSVDCFDRGCAAGRSLRIIHPTGFDPPGARCPAGCGEPVSCRPNIRLWMLRLFPVHPGCTLLPAGNPDAPGMRREVWEKVLRSVRRTFIWFLERTAYKRLLGR